MLKPALNKIFENLNFLIKTFNEFIRLNVCKAFYFYCNLDKSNNRGVDLLRSQLMQIEFFM